MTDSKTPQASIALAVFNHTGSTPDCFELHEHGVVCRQGDSRTYAAFADIQDLCLFASGPDAASGLINSFAYRTHPAHGWTRVPAEVGEFNKLMDAFRSRYVAQRLPVLEEAIAGDARVAFRYIRSGHFPDLDTQEISLSAEGLHMGDATWPYESLKRIDLNQWTETISLEDEDGKTVFACPAVRVLSSDLFVNLVYDQLGRTAEYA
ncbi:hypothetical protein [Achromobacter insolitus]|uniref:Uncharacterized protein n=1 Tax=Achromobacter insolitus TaxID=217204 RepID=A0A6S7FNN4_9BURK|nr:hypothetical protein [Achromobacter insolitus]CAB3932299.1 hypothetical protein LMG5997_00852 [Achromobacter insolitus]CAB3939245.1 hypothetical protein LMG6000_06148 [Achromobacter insolitus]